MIPSAYNYQSVLDSFFDASDISSDAVAHLKPLAESCARMALLNPDVTYMPAFKVLDFLSSIVKYTLSIASEPHLRHQEAYAMLSQLLKPDSALCQHFIFEAALERIRYEPVMLVHKFPSALEKRNAALMVRLTRMVALYDAAPDFSDHMHHAIMDYASQAIASSDFAAYRAGPMCQLFAEMLQTIEASGNQESYENLLGPNSTLWRRFRLKSQRFSANPNDPLVTGENAERIFSVVLNPAHLH